MGRACRGTTVEILNMGGVEILAGPAKSLRAWRRRR